MNRAPSSELEEYYIYFFSTFARMCYKNKLAVATQD